MKRVIITASHSNMADGLKDTLNFVSGGAAEVVALSAYKDNKPVEEEIESLMAKFSDDTELVILTDIAAGSVNQKFFKYRSRPHTHIISGMNLPLAFTLAMESDDEYLTAERVAEAVEEARAEIRYMADLDSDEDDEDE